MTGLKTHTPKGALDITVQECFIKNEVENTIKNVFCGFGYFEVQTPTFEFIDVFSNENTTELIKFIDRNGNILALRHDITTPIARMSATKLKNEILPIRLSYVGRAFRDGDAHAGALQKEFTQAGIELLGQNSPEADAEIIAATVKALCSVGLTDFQIDIGHSDFFKSLAMQAGLSADKTEALRLLIDNKSFVGINELISECDIAIDVKKLILDMPNMFGGIEIIDNINLDILNDGAKNAIKNIVDVYRILVDYGCEKYIAVDLGMVQGLNYYTGIITKGYARGVGFPICGGGRYDNLVGEFGRDLPATGMAIGIERIISALIYNKKEFDVPTVNTMVCYKDARKEAFLVAQALRESGLTVEMCLCENPTEYAMQKGIGGIVSVINSVDVEIINVLTNEKTKAFVSDFAGGELL